MTTSQARGVNAGSIPGEGDPTTRPQVDSGEGRPASRALTPGSPEWYRIVTASKVAAILGHSPYESPRSMWHLMRGDVQPDPESSVMKRGHYLEEGVLRWWLNYTGATPVAWQPCYELGDWAAATPDLEADLDGRPVIVDAKTTTRDDEWGEPGTADVPLHYLTSSYWQMHDSGIHECRLAVLFSYLTFAEYVVTYDPEVGAVLEKRCREFYDSLSGDEPPELDDHVATVAVLRRLHPDIERKAVVDIDPDEARKWLQAHATVDAAEREKRMRDALMYERAGRAQYLHAGGVRFARRQSNGEGKGVSLRKIATAADIPTSQGVTA